MASRAAVSVREVQGFLPHFSSKITQKQPAVGSGTQEGTKWQNSSRQGLKSAPRQSGKRQEGSGPATRQWTTPHPGTVTPAWFFRIAEDPYNPSTAPPSGPAVGSSALPSSPLLSKSSFLFLYLPHPQPVPSYPQPKAWGDFQETCHCEKPKPLLPCVSSYLVGRKRGLGSGNDVSRVRRDLTGRQEESTVTTVSSQTHSTDTTTHRSERVWRRAGTEDNALG